MNHRDIIYTALSIMELECGAQCKGFIENYQRQRSNKRTWLEWAINITKRLPDDRRARIQIIDYARGVGDEVWSVRKFISSIPNEVWEDGQKIANII